MAQKLILYTCESEGITLGVQGETWMECLLALSDEFGEGLLPLYEKAREELTQLSAAVAETYAEELEEVGADIAEAIAHEVATKQQEEAESEAERKRRLIAESEVPDDAAPPDSGARQASLDEDAAGSEAARSGDPGTPVCSVCGADTTPDFAKLTVMEHGEVRCPDCTP